MVCGSYFRGNLQITPGGHSPETPRTEEKELKLITTHLTSLHRWCLIHVLTKLVPAFVRIDLTLKMDLARV